MEKSIFGIFTLIMLIACLVFGTKSLKQKKYALAIIFYLNALSNLVNCIHAFSGII